MKPPGSPYNTSAYRRAKTEFFATVAPICQAERCHAPSRHVDMTLPGSHEWGPTVDHKQPTSRGGPFWAGWRLAHRKCNTARGNKTPARGEPVGRSSRSW